MNLAQWQADFRTWLVTGEQDGARSFGERAMAGLAVYQNTYRSQLVNCLEASYPKIARWLGEETFRAAAITHVDDHPPQGWSLDTYGKDFGETLLTMFPRNPDLHELAWIEWALGEAFVAPDVVPLSTEALAAVDWDEARLQLAPSLRHCAARTNADDIWSTLHEDASRTPEGQMLDAPGGFVVWRRGYLSRLRRFDGDDYAALRSLLTDARFDAFCESLVMRHGEDAGVGRAGALLADWLDAGLIVGVDH